MGERGGAEREEVRAREAHGRGCARARAPPRHARPSCSESRRGTRRRRVSCAPAARRPARCAATRRGASACRPAQRGKWCRRRQLEARAQQRLAMAPPRCARRRTGWESAARHSHSRARERARAEPRAARPTHQALEQRPRLEEEGRDRHTREVLPGHQAPHCGKRGRGVARAWHARARARRHDAEAWPAAISDRGRGRTHPCAQ